MNKPIQKIPILLVKLRRRNFNEDWYNMNKDKKCCKVVKGTKGEGVIMDVIVFKQRQPNNSILKAKVKSINKNLTDKLVNKNIGRVYELETRHSGADKFSFLWDDEGE